MASGSSGTPWSWPKSETSMVPTPFSCTRTRKSSRPRSTGRCVPGARPAEVAPGMVKRSPPRLLLWLAWICSLLRVLSDGGGWNGDGAAGCPAVVVVVGVVGVGAGAGGGGDGVVVRAGTAGAVRRAGPGSACGVSGAGGDGCGAGVSGAGVAGVSGVGVVAGGLSGGVSVVCDDATPPTQSSMSAELLSRSTRLLWIDITRPTSLTGTTRQPRQSTHDGESTAAWGIGPALAGAGAVRDQIAVRLWEVRARGTARRVMRSDQIRRPLRAATRRKHWAPATTASRPAPMRRRDG